MSETNREAVLAAVLALRERLEGQSVPPLNQSKIPNDIRALAPDAHALGVSDEAIQQDLTEVLTAEYVTDLSARIEHVRESLDRWLLEPVGPIGYERVAFINLGLVINAFWDAQGVDPS
jgi:hypothetical protein